jgi:AcrR family transcriptional regulator
MRRPAAEPSTSDRPLRLPSGRHRIPDQEVRDHQHTRLIEAITILSAERGYANVVIADIVACAAVSKSTFYRFYRTKDECLFDAHKLHSAALIAAVDRSCHATSLPRPERLRAGVRSAFSYLSGHPQAAHLLSLGILSTGPRGAHRYAVMIEALRTRAQAACDLGAGDSTLAAIHFGASAITHILAAPEQIELSDLESEVLDRLLTTADRPRDRGAYRTTVGRAR